ncbi:putative inactive poly [ADP-ribose] polymerase SRO5 [Raphanus sativus]|uniref:Probable inactive poly [ADP-ribose] polymerase SRO5 n=1 Tax=Raphanus sativus TaxID=3726 RepID=A0A9W3DSF8_RAPSA|nr:probable inactive poly [ADP-ribose] polymerase SRO5 [Raphanus sativus]KAJ4897418.1 putative inactive poly [ADP-ribose] polymerase SRO5 [Raphanus sativus]
MDYARTESLQASLDSEQEGSTISESGSCDAYDHPRPSFAEEHGLVELLEGDKAYDLIYRNCKSGLGGDQCQLLSILRNGFGTLGARAKLKSFQVFQEAVETKHVGGEGGGGSRVKYGWCAVTKAELKSVLEYGFSQPSNDGSYGRGLYLSPDNALLECVKESAADSEDGMRFLLLSRVILGKSEVVPRGSTQSCPSSPEFDSGVDDLASPKKYIVWSTHMNTHLLPEFLVCIKTPFNFNRKQNQNQSPRRLRSPWMPFPVLIKALSKFLPQSQIFIIQKHYRDQQDMRISRSELIQRVRRITGDKLLVHIIKTLGHKVQQR